MFDDNLIANNCAAMVYLSQQDTLSFKAGMATVQVRLLLIDDTAMASGEIPLEVGRVTKDGEIY